MMNPGSPAATVGTIQGITNTVAVFFSPANPAVQATFSTSGTLAVVPVTGVGDAMYDETVNAAYTIHKGVVSTSNSSTATLTSGSVFTGTSESVKDYAWVQVNVISDVASATDGLSLQQSSNGTNWDIVDTYTIPAATGKVFSVQPAAQFFRIVYTNGGTNQTSFRLQTVFKYVGSKGSSQRAGDGYTNETDLEQVQSFSMALNSAGTWDRVRIGTGVATGAQRVVLASDSAGSMSISGQTATLNVQLDPGHTLGSISSIGSTVTVQFDPGHELGSIKGNSNTLTVFLPDTGHEIGTIRGNTNTLTVFLPDTGHEIGSIRGIANSISVHLLSTGGTIQVKLDPSSKIAGIDSTIGVYLNATAGTLSVQLKPGAIATDIGATQSLFVVSGSTSGISTLGTTLVSPSASYSFKVYAYSIQTTGAVSLTAKFTNGAGSATEFWRPLVTAAGVTGAQGANLATQPGAPIFATGTNTTLSLVLDTATLTHYSVSYTKESA